MGISKKRLKGKGEGGKEKGGRGGRGKGGFLQTYRCFRRILQNGLGTARPPFKQYARFKKLKSEMIGVYVRLTCFLARFLDGGVLISAIINIIY